MAKFTFDESAFDDINNMLDDLSDKATNFGERNVSIEELFNDEFMTLHANSVNIIDFFTGGKIDVDLVEDFNDLSDDAFDNYVSEKTDFSSWDDMYSEAIDSYLNDQLGL